MKTRLMALVMGATLALALTGSVAAGSPTKLTFGGASTTRVEGELALSATLKDASGKALGDRQIEFYQKAEFFGEREAFLGSADTGSDGSATIAYAASEIGRPTIVARFRGDKTLDASNASAAIDVTVAARMYEAAPLPLAGVSRYLPFILGAVVLATWAVLLGVFLSTIAGIRGAVRAPAREPEAAVAQAVSSAGRR